MITVFGATGCVGSQVVEGLLQAGQPVRALGRSVRKLSALEQLGARVMAGDASDVNFLSRAFAGAAAVFIVMPHDVRAPDYQAEQDLIGTALTAALREARVSHIVFLSSLGADQAEGTGVVTSLHRQEGRLERLPDCNVLMLRAGAFYENLFASLPLIKTQGVLAEAVAPDLWIPMVATRDIARIATNALLSRDWQGTQTREITGPHDLTYSHVAEVMGRKLERPDLTYVQMSYDDMAGVLQETGFSRDVAVHYVGLSRGLNEGRVKAREPHGLRHVGLITFDSFADELAAAYRQLSA